jgi:hypothetical protein
MMAKPPADRWLALGAMLMSVGAALSVGYWIYGLQASPKVSFWHLPGYIGGVLLVLGLIVLVIGFFGRVEDSRLGGIQQTQRTGDHSVNIQAGRDIMIHKDEDS